MFFLRFILKLNFKNGKKKKSKNVKISMTKMFFKKKISYFETFQEFLTFSCYEICFV